jgi:Ca2+-transporting ATPase
MKNSTRSIWHELSHEAAATQLKSDASLGLSEADAAARLQETGPNQMTARKRMSEWKRFLIQFAQPLMYILLLAAAVTFFLAEYVDSAVIFGVALINAIVGFLQESKAEKAIEALSEMVRTVATVRRGGLRQKIDSVGLVPGDVVLLQSGDRVPADVRLV